MGGGGGGGGEGFGGAGGGWEGRRKEAEEARGLKVLGSGRWGVGEEAAGSERNCISMAASDFRMAREDDDGQLRQSGRVEVDGG